jgi:hypothetical protein
MEQRIWPARAISLGRTANEQDIVKIRDAMSRTQNVKVSGRNQHVPIQLDTEIRAYKIDMLTTAVGVVNLGESRHPDGYQLQAYIYLTNIGSPRRHISELKLTVIAVPLTKGLSTMDASYVRPDEAAEILDTIEQIIWHIQGMTG